MNVPRRVLYAREFVASDFRDDRKSLVKTYFLLMGRCGANGSMYSVRPLLVVCRK